ncbi:Z1 domain-containing protein [Porticoccaceae bacterium]|nr:Z1 domain-containing protein [Porticoccaceae bacterium]
MTEIDNPHERKKWADRVLRRCLFEIEIFQDDIKGETVSIDEVRKILRDVRVEMAEKLLILHERDFEQILFQLESNTVRVDDQNRAVLVSGTKVKEWLNAASIEWDFWKSYQNMLSHEGKSFDVIKEHERVIDAALDMSGDPNLPGPWKPRKGLIMGNVQAGKTMNFIGLLNKALDVGYHTVIVLGGHMNELRKQAQIRVDEGLLGRDTSSIKVGEIDTESRDIGVAGFPSIHGSSRPNPLTSRDSDFNKSSMDNSHINFAATPVVFVIKKNVSVLRSLISWVKSYKNSKGRDKPMILIDDEADYASINTKSQKNDYAATNAAIKELLGLFEKPTYVGYTATPFANVFIPYEDTVSGELDDDLFPSDFMLKMPIPPNYQGQDYFFPANKLISEAPHVKKIENIDDRTGWLPLKHKKDIDIDGLHPQLEEAICYFICVTALRFSRGQKKSHNTMLVNVSRFNDVQCKVAGEVLSFLTDIQEAIKAFGSLDIHSAKSSSRHIKKLFDVFNNNFLEKGVEFRDILSILVQNISRIKVEMVNGLAKKNTANRSSLNYDANKENGLWVIAIGGLKLSRGLTLEGLSVSFFLRNAAAYDTLTQMCRWFGYHPGFEDLCKLYLLKSSYDHYSTVAQSIRELYQELKWMELTPGSTPRDFGLKVLASDTALLVTAKNKMGTGKEIDFNYRLWGEPVYYFRALADKRKNEKNYALVSDFIERLIQDSHVTEESKSNSHVFEDVPYEQVIDLISNLNNPSSSSKKNQKVPLLQAFSALKREQMKSPTVILFSRSSNATKTNPKNLVDEDGSDIIFNREHQICGKSVFMIARSFEEKNGQISSPNTLISDSDDLKCLFSEHNYQELKSKYKKANQNRDVKLDNNLFRRNIEAPVIVIYLVSALVDNAEKSNKKIAHGDTPTIMYAIHFPSNDNAKDIEGNTNKSIAELDQKKSYIINEVLRGIDVDDAIDEDEYDI